MARNNNRYKQMERYMTYAILFSAVMFILFLVGSGSGTVWLKVVSAILSIGVSVLCLAFLYLSRELLRPRSLWITVSAVSIIVCILFSLMLGYPSPNPLH